jgi:hypothetical protein
MPVHVLLWSLIVEKFDFLIVGGGFSIFELCSAVMSSTSSKSDCRRAGKGSVATASYREAFRIAVASLLQENPDARGNGGSRGRGRRGDLPPSPDEHEERTTVYRIFVPSRRRIAVNQIARIPAANLPLTSPRHCAFATRRARSG